MKTLAILFFSSLTSLVSSQAIGPAAYGVEQVNAIARDLITPVAVLHPRATTTADFGVGDCSKSFSKWLDCTGEGMDDDLCGLDLMNPTKTEGIDTKCACDKATALYNCYTSYCSTGTEFKAYYTGVSVCASMGMGAPPPAPTGAAATLVGNGGAGGGSKPNAGSAIVANDFVIWTMWFGIALGSLVVMLL
ncbi:hypothetical protein V8F20_007081 [Naviculisporaceae sp. PSN 640]